MPQRIVWTEQADAEILRLRHEGVTWDAIARRLAVGRNSVVGRGLALLGGTAETPAPRPVSAPARPPVTNRAPLPPGHPIAWEVITEETSLAGSPYPYPVFA